MCGPFCISSVLSQVLLSRREGPVGLRNVLSPVNLVLLLFTVLFNLKSVRYLLFQKYCQIT